MKITFLPHTKYGWIALLGTAGFILFIALFFFLNAVVPDTGATGFFGNPHLAITLLLSWASATVGLVFALLALFIKKDCAITSLLAVVIGAFVMLFALGELFVPGA